MPDNFGNRLLGALAGGDGSVQISGGTVSGQVSTGDNAMQSQSAESGPVIDVMARIEELLPALEADTHTHARALRDLGDIREEITSAEPDPDRLHAALDRLAARVSHIAPLASLVQELATLIGH